MKISRKTSYYDAYFNDTYTEVRVEEYKRPKFEVIFNDIDSPTYLMTYSIKESQSIFEAHYNAIKYTVERKLNYNTIIIYHSRFERQLPEKPRLMQKEISVSTESYPDEDIDSDPQPTFTYSVEATVTDVNGEHIRHRKNYVVTRYRN